MFLEPLASLYEELAGPPGIPWDGLVAKGHGLTANGYDPAYMDIMLQQSMMFFGVLGGLSDEFRQKYRTIENSEARKAVSQTLALVNQTGADVWQAVKEGDWGATVGFPEAIAVDVFATLAASAVNGAYLHFDGVVEAAMRAGKLTPDEVMIHADWVTKTLQTFVTLDRNGHLNQFKPGAPVSGLGIAPVIAGWLIALGIVAVLGVCYCYYVHSIAAPVQNKLFEWCDKLATKKDAADEDLRTCIAAAKSMQENGNGGLGDFMGGILKPIAAVAGIGLLIYVGSMVLPVVLAKKVVA